MIEEETSHTEQFLLPNNSEDLSAILEKVSANNQMLNSDFRILIAKINEKSREVEISRRSYNNSDSTRHEQKEHIRVLKDRKGCVMEMVVAMMDKAVKDGDNDPRGANVKVLMDDITHLQIKTSEIESDIFTANEDFKTIDTECIEKQWELDELMEQKKVLEDVISRMIRDAESARTELIKGALN